MSTTRRWSILCALIVAGEMIFALPFHLTRFFRSTMLDVYGLTNTQLGDAFALYGLCAMAAYFFGGPLADRFSPRRLLSISLFMTALGGMFMLKLSTGDPVHWLFAYWGVTTILLFWSGLIRATREWGGALNQGSAFGLLDGGRGLVAALFATLTTALLAESLGTTFEEATAVERFNSFAKVIYFYSIVTAATGLLVWIVIPDSGPGEIQPRFRFQDLGHVVAKPIVWMQGVIIVCAYCGYKGLDNYGLYVEQVLGLSNAESNTFMSRTAYIRVIAAVAAGFLADRFFPSRVVIGCFALALVAYGLLSTPLFGVVGLHIVLLNLVVTFVSVYALRGVYFALIEQSKTPKHLTGTTAGIISVVGFTPDFFFNAISGRILDAAPGAVGFQYYFLLLTGFAVLGLVTTCLFARRLSLKSN